MVSRCVNEVGIDSHYLSRLYPSRPATPREIPRTNSSSITSYSHREMPLLIEEQRIKHSIQGRNEVYSADEIVQNENLFSSLFNGLSLEEKSPLLSFQKVSRPVLNVIEENVTSQEKTARQQAFLKEYQCITVDFSKSVQAGGLSCDFYSSVLDVSAKDHLVIALGDSLYVTGTELDNKTMKTFSFGNERDPISCVHSIGKTSKIFNGFRSGSISYIDYEAQKATEVEKVAYPFKKQFCCAASAKNGAVFYGGTRDGFLLQIDSRTSFDQSLILSKEEKGSLPSVCGLALSPDGIKLAVGTDCNEIKIWDLRKIEKPYLLFDCYKAAVKALVWSPWENNVIFAGGGRADPAIRKLSTFSGKILAEDTTADQVTAIHACNEVDKIVTCHGWSGVSMVLKNDRNRFIRKMELTESKGRVLHSALNLDKTMLFTTSGVVSDETGADESTLEVWKIGEALPKKNREPLFNGPHSYMR